MRKRIAAILFAFGASMVHAEPTTQPGGPMQEYLDRVPETLTDESIKSYDVIATFGSNASPVVVRIRKTEAGKASLYATCTKRRVPICFWVDRQMIQYDAASGALRRFKDVTLKVAVSDIAGSFKVDFNLNHSDKPATQPVALLDAQLNFRSLLLAAPKNQIVRTVDDYQVITGHTEKGNPVDFWMDPKRKYPLSALAIYVANDPICTFARIELNQPVDDRNMALPSDKELATILPVVAVEPGVFNYARWQAGLALSAMYELAIEDPQRRPGIEAKLGKIDWDKRIAADAEVTRRLIQLIGEQIPPDGRSK